MPSSFEYTPEKLNDKLRQDKQAEERANQLSIEQLQRNLRSRRPQSATVARDDRSLRIMPLAMVVVLILVERIILGLNGAGNLSLCGLFIGLDVLATGTLLRHSLLRSSTR